MADQEDQDGIQRLSADADGNGNGFCDEAQDTDNQNLVEMGDDRANDGDQDSRYMRGMQD